MSTPTAAPLCVLSELARFRRSPHLGPFKTGHAASEPAFGSINRSGYSHTSLWCRVYLINIPYLILQRFRLSLLWFVIAVPFEPSLVVLVVAVAAALKWADYVFAQAPDTPVGIRRARTLATVGFIVAASCGAVAGEANPGPHFPTAVVRMADGSSLSGAYVAYSGGTLYLGEGHAIHVVPGRQLAGFSVHDTPDHTQLPTSLLVRGVDLVADVFPN
jgi:hypothetical protein